MRQYLLLLLVVASSLAHSRLRFDNYQVHRVHPKTPEQLQALRQLEESGNGYDFWTDIGYAHKPVDIMVPPHMKYNFEDFLKLQNLKSELYIKNVQKLIDQERITTKNHTRATDWKRYQTLDEIYAWMDSLQAQYPGIVQSVVGGQSYEGRQIRGVKVSYKSGNKAAFIEGGIHAREWIAPATVTYMLNQLLTSSDPAVRDVAENHDWYIFPSVNPDGYVYTHTRDRMWRKTRKPYGLCVGADPNRNWGYQWMNGGASNNPCFDTYAGSSPFSEIETKSLSDYMETFMDKIEVYFDFHAYSQYLMFPYGHAGLEVPKNNALLHKIGRKAGQVLAQRYGTIYSVGNIPEVIYVASGGSCDWVMNKMDAEHNGGHVYVYELRDTGRHGFLLPADQIIPTGEETLDSVVSIMQDVRASRKH
ncbi:hypothetical protein ILUMI_09935 [Ignelater luminosus]|uniref:Zinc carboxypeptidase A 1 n=1 Tax=Ignelater luminosus TaxID=2038154 RepID=A0A8K0D388_IGNLU|nr:hypothetical protein ILUMI_09935 [Ignelater luminosus]